MSQSGRTLLRCDCHLATEGSIKPAGIGGVALALLTYAAQELHVGLPDPVLWGLLVLSACGVVYGAVGTVFEVRRPAQNHERVVLSETSETSADGRTKTTELAGDASSDARPQPAVVIGSDRPVTHNAPGPPRTVAGTASSGV